MPVISLNNADEFATHKSSSDLLIIDFYATWCGPCKQISPAFERLSNKPENKAAVFAKIDVDKVKSVAQQCSITAMPTFVFFVKGVKQDEVKGADPHALESKLKKYVAESGIKAESSVVRGMVALNSKLDVKQLELLNATESSSVRALFEPSNKVHIESDSDEQLMIYAPFQESVKAHTIVLRAAVEELDHAPSKLRIFVNRPNILSFDDVDSIPSTQTIDTVDYDDKGVALVSLRFVKFQKVNNIVIFVESNRGNDEISKLLSIEFHGEVSPTNSSGVVQKLDHDE